MEQRYQDELNKANILVEDINKTIGYSKELGECIMRIQIEIEDMKTQILSAKLIMACSSDKPLTSSGASLPATVKDAINEVNNSLHRVTIFTREYVDTFEMFMRLVNLVNSTFEIYHRRVTEITATFDHCQYRQHADFLHTFLDTHFERPLFSIDQERSVRLSNQGEMSKNVESILRSTIQKLQKKFGLQEEKESEPNSEFGDSSGVTVKTEATSEGGVEAEEFVADEIGDSSGVTVKTEATSEGDVKAEEFVADENQAVANSEMIIPDTKIQQRGADVLDVKVEVIKHAKNERKVEKKDEGVKANLKDADKVMKESIADKIQEVAQTEMVNPDTAGKGKGIYLHTIVVESKEVVVKQGETEAEQHIKDSEQGKDERAKANVKQLDDKAKEKNKNEDLLGKTKAPGKQTLTKIPDAETKKEGIHPHSVALEAKNCEAKEGAVKAEHHVEENEQSKAEIKDERAKADVKQPDDEKAKRKNKDEDLFAKPTVPFKQTGTKILHTVVLNGEEDKEKEENRFKESKQSNAGKKDEGPKADLKQPNEKAKGKHENGGFVEKPQASVKQAGTKIPDSETEKEDTYFHTVVLDGREDEEKKEEHMKESKQSKAEEKFEGAKANVKQPDEKAKGKNTKEDLIGKNKPSVQQAGTKQNKNIAMGKTKNEDLKKGAVQYEEKDKKKNELAKKTDQKPKVEQKQKPESKKAESSNVQKGNKSSKNEANSKSRKELEEQKNERSTTSKEGTSAIMVECTEEEAMKVMKKVHIETKTEGELNLVTPEVDSDANIVKKIPTKDVTSHKWK